MPAATPLFTYSATVAERAIIQRIGVAAGAEMLTYLNAVLEHEGVGDPARSLMRATALTGEGLQRVAPDSSEAGLHKAAKAAVDRDIAPKFRLLQEAGHGALASVDKRWNDAHTPQFPKGSEAAVRAARVSWWRESPAPARLAAALADPSLAASVVEAGPFAAGLPPEAFEQIVGAMAVGQLAATLAGQHDYLTEPSHDDPIAGAVDHGKARKAAEDKLQALKDERELLVEVAPLLSSVTNAVAAMTGESREAAFKRLTAR